MSREILVRIALVAAFAWPVASPAEELTGYSGVQLYQRFCASCHGKGAEGDGPVAATFKATVPDLTLLARRRGDQFPRDLVRRVIDGRDIKAPHGSREMPVWGQEFWQAQGADDAARAKSAALVEQLVVYLESIQRKR
jgi:mono/diheme cytochrome c family protein